MKIGGVEIEFLGHDGFKISSGKTIIIDPYQVSGNAGKADILLITHGHYDHCSIEDIKRVVGNGTAVVCPADCQSKIMDLGVSVNMQVVEVKDVLELGDVTVECVPAYNKNKDFHPKSEGWLGYVIKIGNVIIYHAGDSDFIPEMQKLSGYGKHGNTFVALLPVSGKYVMDVEEAVEAASVIGPDIVIPMHYGSGVAGTVEDANRFVELCKEKGINAIVLERI